MESERGIPTSYHDVEIRNWQLMFRFLGEGLQDVLKIHDPAGFDQQ
jgi:hypothetical protein